MTNKKSTKRSLIMSGLALFICISMFIGSTYAWFTDSVTSSGNKIKAGTLDIQLLMDDNVDGKYEDISNSTSPIFGEGSIAQNNNAETLWEPGKTQVAYLAIKNNGQLALKYTVGLDVQNVSKDLYEVMEYAIVPDADANNKVTSWTSGNSVEVGTQSVSGDVSLPVGATHYFALVIHMDEEAGNEYQGGEVNFDLTVLATQDTVESDSFNKTYDTNATYLNTDAQGNNYFISNANELVYFAKSVNVDGETYAGKTVKLTANIDLAGKLWIPVGQTQVSSFQGTFDGQGHTIKNMTVNYTGTNSNYACGLFGWIELHNGAPIVIQNVKFDKANVTGIKYTGVVAGYANGASGAEIKNCVVTNSTVTSNSKNAGGIIGYMGKGVLTGNTVSGCTISAKYDVGGIANSVEPAVTFQNNKVENTKIYYEEDQSYDAAGIFTGGKVVYRDDNTKTTFVPDSTNTSSNVTVSKLVTVSTADELTTAIASGEENIVLESGNYGVIDVTVNHNLTLSAAANADVKIAGIDGQSNNNSTNVTIKGVTIDNSLQTEGWYTGTAQKIKPCVGVWGGNYTFENCTFSVTGASGAETGVMSWWTINKGVMNFTNCTFNGGNGSARGMQIYGNYDLNVTNCTFNTAKDYSIKYVGAEGCVATFKNNNVNATTNFVQTGSAPYAGANYKLVFEGNTLATGINHVYVDNAEGQTITINGVVKAATNEAIY